MWGTPNRVLSSFVGMREVDPVAFGERVRCRRDELGISQEAFGKAVGYVQQTIQWIEEGKPKRVRKYAHFADALQTTTQWLFWGEGPRAAGPRYLPTTVIAERYEAMSPEEKARVSRHFEQKPTPKRKSG